MSDYLITIRAAAEAAAQDITGGIIFAESAGRVYLTATNPAGTHAVLLEGGSGLRQLFNLWSLLSPQAVMELVDLARVPVERLLDMEVRGVGSGGATVQEIRDALKGGA